MTDPPRSRPRAAAHFERARTDDRRPSPPRLQPFTLAHTPWVIDLLADAGWDTYTVDAQRTARALLAPGSTTLLALDGARVVALVQVQSDGEIQAHLSALLVATAWRGRGLARRLLYEALTRAGGIHVDVSTKNRAFYEALGAAARPGFRLTLEQLKRNEKPDAASANPLVAATPPQERQ